ncbi:hypothetical protein AMECASPLE_035823 [Ameca splendens]|uniref:Uncharacterized protein n=1 Tax=Ameca splendens TaxID=208324 RepID=A0ABV0YUJ5_9TELE
MEFDLDEFVKTPTLEVLCKCTKHQLLLILDHFKVVVSKHAKSGPIEAEFLTALVQIGIFPASIFPKSPLKSPPSASFTDDAVHLKELEVELREKEFSLEQNRGEKEADICLRELELGVRSLQPRASEFDMSKNI